MELLDWKQWARHGAKLADAPLASLPNIIEVARMNAKLSVSDLANMVGVTVSSIRGWEQGVSRPSPNNVGELASALFLDPKDLECIPHGIPYWKLKIYIAQKQNISVHPDVMYNSGVTQLPVDTYPSYLKFCKENGVTREDVKLLLGISETAMRQREQYAMGLGSLCRIARLLSGVLAQGAPEKKIVMREAQEFIYARSRCTVCEMPVVFTVVKDAFYGGVICPACGSRSFPEISLRKERVSPTKVTVV